MGKQMEGDNQRRRTLAREARENGQRASETGATLGAGKQPAHRTDKRRAGPVPASAPKPPVGRATKRPSAPPSPPLPAAPTEPATGGGIAVIGYRDLVTEVGRRSGVDFADARVAAEATVLALARALSEADRERLLDAVPAELHDNRAISAVNRRSDLAGFLDEVARLSRRTPEQARYQAQATLSALADSDGDLVASLDLPPELRELTISPPYASRGPRA